MGLYIFNLVLVFSLGVSAASAVLDVRTAGEFSEEHAQGALNIDVTIEGFEKKVGTLDKDGEYFVYCKAGGRSAKAVEKMKALGFKNIKDLKTVDEAIRKFGKAKK